MDIPILVYCQGSSSHQGTAAARNAVKGTRCLGAGIGTHEVVAGHLGSGRAAAAGGEVGAEDE
jgi:hypothetical protein